jgi:hypothetical protein
MKRRLTSTVKAREACVEPEPPVTGGPVEASYVADGRGGWVGSDSHGEFTFTELPPMDESEGFGYWPGEDAKPRTGGIPRRSVKETRALARSMHCAPGMSGADDEREAR